MGCASSKESDAPKPKPPAHAKATNKQPEIAPTKPVEPEVKPSTTVVVQSSPSKPPTVEDGSIDRSDRPVEEFYVLGEELGKGGFSIVRKATNRATGQEFAIKFVDKKMIGNKEELELIQREIDIMKQVRHRNVLCLIERFESPERLALVMELVTGGELFYKIVDNGSYKESDAKNIVRQLVEGVDYLHNMGIAHRDLKPENLLCTDGIPGQEMTIKIADFGLSKVFNDGSVLETSCGTPDYAAPEVLRMEGTYDKQVDCWSIGVITYVLLCGFPPFYGKTQNTLFDKILRADYDFPDPEWSDVSEDAKDFIRKLLVIEPESRYTAKQCIVHKWLQSTTTSPSTSAAEIHVDKMRNYMNARKGQAS